MAVDANEIARQAAEKIGSTWAFDPSEKAISEDTAIILAAMQSLVEERDRLTEASQKATFWESAFDGLKKERDRLLARAQKAQGDWDDLAELLSAAVADRDSAQRRVRELSDDLERLKAERDELQAALNQAVDGMNSHAGDVLRLEAEAGAKHEALTETAEQLEVALSRLGVGLQGDGAAHKADEDSWGATKTLSRARAALQPTAGAALLAQMAAMRSVIERRIEACRSGWAKDFPILHDEGCNACRDLREAVKPEAGAAFAARLEKAEADSKRLDAWIAAEESGGHYDVGVKFANASMAYASPNSPFISPRERWLVFPRNSRAVLHFGDGRDAIDAAIDAKERP